MDVEGKLHFLMGILLYVGGDISRTGVLADLPPFQRRLAIFAQAALFKRHAYGHAGIEHFTKWAIEQRGRRFEPPSVFDVTDKALLTNTQP
ncbi:hypothetical protein NYF14_09795 [Sphingobium sp. 10 DY56-G10]